MIKAIAQPAATQRRTSFMTAIVKMTNPATDAHANPRSWLRTRGWL